MTDQDQSGQQKNSGGNWIAIGSILGVGIGAAVGAAADNVGQGTWIGAVIGVGLGFLMQQIRN